METVEEAEPHPFLALVLARMKTNPEEFSPDNSQWRSLIESSKQYLTAEEKKALKAAERDVGLDHLHKKLMGKLLGDKPPPVSTGGYPRTLSTLCTTEVTISGSTPAHAQRGQAYDDMFKQILERLNDLDN